MSTVPLPQRSDSVRESTERTPIWTLNANAENPAANGNYGTTDQQEDRSAIQPPLKSMCDMHRRPDTVCCRTLKGDEERHLLDPDFVRDMIIGLSDGLTVPFGLTAGLAAIGSSKIVVVGGIAELISGALSMGVGGALGTQAERDHYRYLKRTTMARVKRSCAGELEREVTEVLGCVGVDEATCRKVAMNLMKVETQINNQEGDEEEDPRSRNSFMHSILRSIARKPRTQYDDTENGTSSSSNKLKFSDDVGLTAFLLKFGEGMEEVPTSKIYRSALTIGLAYAVGGAVPLIPYFFVNDVRTALFWSIGVTAITLIIFGILKAYHTGAKLGFSGYFQSALTTLLVGGAAAGSAFAICAALES